MHSMSRIKNTDVNELIALAEDVGLTQRQVADNLKITQGYWYQVRYGKMPLADELIARVRELKKKLKDFAA